MAKNDSAKAPAITVMACQPVNYDGALHAPGDEFDVLQPDLDQLQAVFAVAVKQPAT